MNKKELLSLLPEEEKFSLLEELLSRFEVSVGYQADQKKIYLVLSRSGKVDMIHLLPVDSCRTVKLMIHCLGLEKTSDICNRSFPQLVKFIS